MRTATIELTFSSLEIGTIRKMRLDLFADGGFETEGDWKASDKDSTKLLKIYLGKSSGHWKYKTFKGRPVITLYDQDDPNFVSFYWRDFGRTVCDLLKVGPLPLTVGRKGSGFQGAAPMNPLNWAVISTI